jgi:5'-methylthioadenosine phosphorylase
MTERINIGVIGGSGLYKMPELSDIEEQPIDTPFGSPSAPVVIGTLRGRRVAFLPRHGIGHVFTPSTVPYRANIYALKLLGVRHIIAVNACGSLREDYMPGDIVIPDQLIDYTKADRGRTFFDTGLVAHVSVAEPFCPQLSDEMAAAVRAVGGVAHAGGRYVTIEGPRFSTRGESEIYRRLGCSIIGMTTCPEAFLAREAEICYASMSHITDYDVWHESEEPVTVDRVVAIMHRNLQIAQAAIAETVERLAVDQECACHRALDDAILTERGAISKETAARLQAIISRVLPDV